MIRADCHVHLYPSFRLDRLLQRLSALESEGIPRAYLLAERHDCNAFDLLKSLSEVSDTSEGVVRVGGGYWVAGRQVVTAERLEVLALCTEKQFRDGLPFNQCLQMVKDAGAVSVTSWAPGKWTFGRERIIRDAIEQAKPGELLLADSSLRPAHFPEPALLKLGRQKGLGVIAGTDPLPFAGQENLIGSYGALLPNFDPARPLESLVKSLTTERPNFQHFGHRSSLFGVADRLFRLKFQGKGPAHQSQRASG